MNRFHKAHAQSGSVTAKQLAALDRFRVKMSAREFNAFRASVGVPSAFPNRRLSSKEAHQLLARIVAEVRRR